MKAFQSGETRYGAHDPGRRVLGVAGAMGLVLAVLTPALVTANGWYVSLFWMGIAGLCFGMCMNSLTKGFGLIGGFMLVISTTNNLQYLLSSAPTLGTTTIGAIQVSFAALFAARALRRTLHPKKQRTRARSLRKRGDEFT